MIFPFHDENPTTRPPIVTVGLIVINVLVLFYMGHVEKTEGNRALRAFIYTHGFIPLRLKQIQHPQVMRVDLFPEQQQQQNPWRVFVPQPNAFLDLPASRGQILLSLITAMFLHANLLHLIGNMWFLWLFGNNIEDRLGHFLFLGFYLVGGIMASLVHWAMSPNDALNQPIIGASGAVAVILGAYAVTYPFANVRSLLVLIIFITVIDLPALVVLGSWFFIQLFNGILPPVVGMTVAWWAHIGGFVAGAAIMPFLPGGGPPVGSWQEWESGGRPTTTYGER